MHNIVKSLSLILMILLCQVVSSISTPVITFATSQPKFANSSMPILSIGKTSPYEVSCVASDPTDPLATTGILLNITNNPTLFSFSSGTTSVVSNADCKCELVSGSIYKLTLKPCGVGYSIISIKAFNGTTSSAFKIKVAASKASLNPLHTIYPTTIADASAASPVDDDYMFIADDETNVLRLFNRHYSGQSVDTLDITKEAGGITGEEFDLEASSLSVKYNAGKRIYWTGSLGNSKKGNLKPYRDRVVATDISGIGVSAKLSVKSYCVDMRTALVSWGDNCGWNFTSSAAEGMIPKRIDGFNVEGLSVAPGGDTAWVGFRAPCVPLKNVTPLNSNRIYAVAAPVINFETIMNVSGKSSIKPIVGEPVLFDFGGLGIRSMERVGNAGYVIVAGLFEGGGTPAVYLWDGKVSLNSGFTPVTTGKGMTKLDIDMSDLVQASPDGGLEGHPEALMAEQSGNVITIHLICDNGTVDYYGDGNEAKLLDYPYKKFRMDDYVYTLPALSGCDDGQKYVSEFVKVSEKSILSLDDKLMDVYNPFGINLAKNVKKFKVPYSGIYVVVKGDKSVKVFVR